MALQNFNKTKPKKKNTQKENKSSQKFPMPRCHKENTYPDRNLNFIGLTHEMIQYYDQKKLPESYLDFIENTITYKNKNTQKSTSRKIRKTQKQNLTTKEKEKNVPFETIENLNFVLKNTIKVSNKTGPHLPYLEVALGTGNPILALKDSGASHSLLDINEFKNIEGFRNISVKTKQCVMVTANATTEDAIQGEVKLPITMTDINNEEFTIRHTFLLTNLGERQKCILGYDLLGNEDIILGETPRLLYITTNLKYHAVDIVKKELNTQKQDQILTNKRKIEILANTTQIIELVFRSNFRNTKKLDNSDCLFQPSNKMLKTVETYGVVFHPSLTIPKKISETQVIISALVTNTNNEKVIFRENTEIRGHLENISENHKNIKVSEEDFTTLVNSLEIQDSEPININNVEFIETNEQGIFNMKRKNIEINSIYNRNENMEEETKMEDGSTRTQLTANVEDILDCETIIDPTDLLDKQEKLDITMADYKSVPGNMMEELMQIVNIEMEPLWSKHKWDIGKTDRIQHDIETKEGVVVRNKKRSIPFQRLKYAQKAVNTLMKYNLVTPSYNTKWATNLVLVQKPTEGTLRDSSKASKIHNRKNNTNCSWRLTQDLRSVNKETTNTYTATLPTIDEIVHKCRNKTITQFDINQAYFTIGLSQRSKSKTSFYLNDLMYKWEVMTQGLSGAPHTFMKFMYLIYSDTTLDEWRKQFPDKSRKLKEKHWYDFLSIYMDDLTIFSDTKEDNMIHIHAVLWIMLREGCKLNPKKAIFMTTNFTCLGVSINTKENNISIDKKRAQGILSWPKPSSLLEVMSRIQSLNYLSKNLPKLKEIAYPLLSLLRTKKFVWNKEHQESWEHLKQLIRLDIRLTIPDENLEYVTSSDTSKIAVAGNLWNYDPKRRKLYLLGCMSKLLSVSDSLKPPYHKECLALSLNLKTWETYILGTENRITALCDARGVLWLHRNKEFSNKLTTISLYISQFRNLVIWHIPGTQNQLADIFSRSYHTSAHKTSEDLKLSKEQANMLPPLPNPCVLTSEDLFKIFSTLPESESHMDRGNRKRRPLPTPKPLLNIMKQLEESTPEEKFVSARRILEGWNDPSIGITKCNMTQINGASLTNRWKEMEKQMENKYISEQYKYMKTNTKTEEGKQLSHKLDLILKGNLNNEEKMSTIKRANELIPSNMIDNIKDRVATQLHEKKSNKKLLETINPSKLTIENHTIMIPKDDTDKQILKESISEMEQTDKNYSEIVVNMLEVIPESRENDKMMEERMMTTMADILENKGELSKTTLVRLQHSDKFCMKILKQLETNEGAQPSFSIINNILIKTKYDSQRKQEIVKIVIPDSIMPMICREIHRRKTIHQPRNGSIMKFEKYFYNKQISTHMEDTIQNCIICKYTHKPSGNAAQGPGLTRTLQMENLKPREAIAVDLAIGLPLTETESCHALTVICLKTNYGQIYPLKTRTATEVCKKLETGWFKHYSPPKYIYADLGNEFFGQFTQLCCKYGIEKYATFADSHQGNRAELLIKAFKNNTRKIIHDYSNKYQGKDWENILPVLIPRINQSIIYPTKTLSRELLMFGDEIDMPLLELDIGEQNYFENRELEKEKYLIEYDKLRQNRKKYYRTRTQLEVRVQDIVWIKNRLEEYPKSLKVQYIGPMRVTKVFPLGVTAYHMISGNEMSAHMDHIKKLTLNQYEESMPKGWEADIKKHILHVAKANKTNKVDIVFEEEETT